MPFLASLVKSYSAFRTKIICHLSKAFLDTHTTVVIAFIFISNLHLSLLQSKLQTRTGGGARINSVLLDRHGIVHEDLTHGFHSDAEKN